MNNILKLNKQKYKLWRCFFFFLSFSILCISCMLMFCACFCKDWMRYCNILTTIALDSYTSQLSINMLKEEKQPPDHHLYYSSSWLLSSVRLMGVMFTAEVLSASGCY